MISLFCGVFADVVYVDRKLPCFGVFCNCSRKQSYLLCLLSSPTKKRYQIQWLHIDNIDPVKILMLPRDCKLNDNMRKQIKSYTTRKNMDDNLNLRTGQSILVPRAAILLASATDRELWQTQRSNTCACPWLSTSGPTM